MATTWLPAVVLASLLRATRSLTLVVQLLVIFAVVAVVLLHVAIPDADAFWQPYLEATSTLLQQQGVELDTTLLTAEIMMMSAVLGYWLLFTLSLLLGNALYRAAPGERTEFGRFRDLDLGRVIAVLGVVLALLAFAIQSVVLKNVAFLVFATFTLQGLALLHWLKDRGVVPVAVLVATYVLLPLLQELIVAVVALLGFADAWLQFRRRDIGKQG